MTHQNQIIYSSPIRIIGDPILHRPGILFPEIPTSAQQEELTKQIAQAKSILIQTGGAGIAANQCADIENPYRFTIVGVFHEIPEHATKVNKRYPNVIFPHAKIMVNPVVTSLSSETQQFNHACLSIPCPNRCAVMSPKEISVRYKDPMDNMYLKQLSCSDIDAVVLWHELTHILDGKTYMDVTFESLPKEDLYQFKDMLHQELQNRRKTHASSLGEFASPPFHFTVKIKKPGKPRLEVEELKKVLPKITEDTLVGLLNQLNRVIT